MPLDFIRDYLGPSVDRRRKLITQFRADVPVEAPAPAPASQASN